VIIRLMEVLLIIHEVAKKKVTKRLLLNM